MIFMVLWPFVLFLFGGREAKNAHKGGIKGILAQVIVHAVFHILFDQLSDEKCHGFRNLPKLLRKGFSFRSSMP
jgi:hypothetical protein